MDVIAIYNLHIINKGIQKGEEIPLYARILAVADTVDAMHADRPYRKGRSAEVIVAELKRCSGTQFDPNVVEAFQKTIAKGSVQL